MRIQTLLSILCLLFFFACDDATNEGGEGGTVADSVASAVTEAAPTEEAPASNVTNATVKQAIESTSGGEKSDVLGGFKNLVSLLDSDDEDVSANAETAFMEMLQNEPKKFAKMMSRSLEGEDRQAAISSVAEGVFNAMGKSGEDMKTQVAGLVKNVKTKSLTFGKEEKEVISGFATELYKFLAPAK